MFAMIVLLLIKTTWFKTAISEDVNEFIKSKPQTSSRFSKEWKRITNRLKSGDEQEYKMAVVEADSLLCEILDKMKFEGETLREKLTKTPKIIIDDIKEVEKAHEIRDNVVHDPDYQLSLDQAKKVLDIYEKVLIQLDLA